MKKILYILFIGFALGFICSCKDNTQDPSALRSITHSNCKNTIMDDTKQDCIRFEYDGEDVLKIFHINAGFNCCPDHFNIPVKLVGDRIIIDEKVVGGLCDCNCLYDLTYTLSGIEPGIYNIEIDEPFVGSIDRKLSLTADLGEKEGEYCITRCRYPW